MLLWDMGKIEHGSSSMFDGRNLSMANISGRLSTQSGHSHIQLIIILFTRLVMDQSCPNCHRDLQYTDKFVDAPTTHIPKWYRYRARVIICPFCEETLKENENKLYKNSIILIFPILLLMMVAGLIGLTLGHTGLITLFFPIAGISLLYFLYLDFVALKDWPAWVISKKD